MKELETIAIKLEVDDVELQQTRDTLEVINVQLDNAIAKLKEAIALRQRLEPDRMRRMSGDFRISFSDNSEAFGQNHLKDYR